MKREILAIALAASLAACGRDSDGRATVEVPGDVDVDVKTDTARLPDIDVKTRTEERTVTTPTVGLQKDTVVVTKPVFGTQKSKVKTPDVDVDKKP